MLNSRLVMMLAVFGVLVISTGCSSGSPDGTGNDVTNDDSSRSTGRDLTAADGVGDTLQSEDPVDAADLFDAADLSDDDGVSALDLSDLYDGWLPLDGSCGFLLSDTETLYFGDPASGTQDMSDITREGDSLSFSVANAVNTVFSLTSIMDGYGLDGTRVVDGGPSQGIRLYRTHPDVIRACSGGPPTFVDVIDGWMSLSDGLCGIVISAETPFEGSAYGDAPGEVLALSAGSVEGSTVNFELREEGTTVTFRLTSNETKIILQGIASSEGNQAGSTLLRVRPEVIPFCVQ